MLDELDQPIDLSPSGQLRRRAILDAARRTSRARARRRRVVQTSFAAAPLVAIALVALWLAPTRTPSIPVPDAPVAERPIVSEPVLVYSVAVTDPSDIDRVLAPTRSASAVEISDDELLDLLRQAGKPTGLIRTDDRVILTSDVTTTSEEGASAPRDQQNA